LESTDIDEEENGEKGGKKRIKVPKADGKFGPSLLVRKYSSHSSRYCNIEATHPLASAEEKVISLNTSQPHTAKFVTIKFLIFPRVG
jgi:hypothetical protein